MIGHLSGLLSEKNPPQIVIDVNGVSYEIEVSMNTIYRLPEVGQKVSVYTHFVVREDAQLLYGFYGKPERTLFRSLIKVNGVGPKLAITILSSSTPDEFVRCVHQQDSASLTKLPGIGKKTAERLVVEMRDRLPDWEYGSASPLEFTEMRNPHDASELVVRKRVVQDAISALIALGYKPNDASRAISAVNNEGKTSEILIRDALKRIASGER
jgi:Holliday junction DNA helicase RuvA